MGEISPRIRSRCIQFVRQAQFVRDSRHCRRAKTGRRAIPPSLLQVPHQPILDGKVEDEIISHTFDQFLNTGDPTWPLLLPMVNSAVRAMDAVQAYGRQAWSLNIEKFTVIDQAAHAGRPRLSERCRGNCRAGSRAAKRTSRVRDPGAAPALCSARLRPARPSRGARPAA